MALDRLESETGFVNVCEVKLIVARDCFSYKEMCWGLLCKIHVNFHVSQQGFSDMASDWLAAVLPADQMPGLEIFVN